MKVITVHRDGMFLTGRWEHKAQKRSVRKGKVGADRILGGSAALGGGKVAWSLWPPLALAKIALGPDVGAPAVGGVDPVECFLQRVTLAPAPDRKGRRR